MNTNKVHIWIERPPKRHCSLHGLNPLNKWLIAGWDFLKKYVGAAWFC